MLGLDEEPARFVGVDAGLGTVGGGRLSPVSGLIVLVTPLAAIVRARR